ncbi:MAG: RNA polymerase sigma-70 factor [Bacteroides sp.]|nr:RNA polymerase sigma-70 factor [Bacteroides sp.]
MLPPKSSYEEFEALFKQFHTRLFYAALDWVDDPEAAKDVVSEVFGDLWKHYDRLRQEPLEGYLFRAVKNRSINHLKRQECERRHCHTFWKERIRWIDNDARLHERRLRLIERTLETLPPQTRFIFEQCHFEGNTYARLAESMGVSSSTVHKHMSRAFAAFRKAFAEQGEQGQERG